MAVADVQGGNKNVFVRGGRFGFCDAQERKKATAGPMCLSLSPSVIGQRCNHPAAAS